MQNSLSCTNLFHLTNSLILSNLTIISLSSVLGILALSLLPSLIFMNYCVAFGETLPSLFMIFCISTLIFAFLRNLIISSGGFLKSLLKALFPGSIPLGLGRVSKAYTSVLGVCTGWGQRALVTICGWNKSPEWHRVGQVECLCLQSM